MDIKTRGKKMMADKMTAYCVSCRERERPMLNPEKVTLKNGRLAAKGTCGVCGGNMLKFLPNEKKS